NVPSALAVLRHATIYLGLPEEIDEAFGVLEQHAIRHGVVYPVALTVVPFLFDIVRKGSPVAERITDLIAEYASFAHTLEQRLQDRLHEIIEDRAEAVMSWIGIHDRATAALAIHVPGLRDAFFTAVELTPRLAPEILLALIELGAGPRPITRSVLDHAI